MPSTEPAFSLDWAPDAVIVTSLDGSIVYVNTRAEDLFGYRREELLEKPVELLMPSGIRHGTAPAKPEIAPLQQGSRIAAGMHRDGTRLPVSVKWRPAPAREGAYLVVSIREANASAEPAPPLEQQRDFFSLFSHDVRQSLQSIQFICDSMADKAPRPAATISEIVAAVKSLLDTIARLNDAGTIKAADERCPLDPLLSTLGRSFEPVARRKGLELVVEDSVEEIRTDPVLLRELLQNLLANAIRYTNEGEVRVRCLPSPSSVRIEVIDTGIGMDAEQIDRLFDGSMSLAASPGKPGSGLGLAIARRLADVLGCRIDVSSTIGRGSSFVVTVPRAGARQEPMRISGRDPAQKESGNG